MKRNLHNRLEKKRHYADCSGVQSRLFFPESEESEEHTFRDVESSSIQSRLHFPKMDRCTKSPISPEHMKIVKIKKIKTSTPTEEQKKRVTSFMLAKAISNFSYFSATLLTLYENFKFDPAVVRRIASKNCAVFDIEGETISLRPYVKICCNYLSLEGCNNFIDSPFPCQNLHICKEFILGTCKNASCSLEHDLNTDQNKSVLDIYKLTLIPYNIILKLFSTVVFKNLSKDTLRVCAFYNKGFCQTSNCKSLHLCLKFLAKLCKENNKNCQFSHDVFSERTLSILKLHDLKHDDTLEDVFRSLLTCPLVKKNIDDLRAKEVAKEEITKTLWSHDYDGNVQMKEICYDSVENFCSKESSGCPKLHSRFHFHWQVLSFLSDENWVNLPFDQVFALENAYCNPSLNKIVLPPLDTTTPQSSCRNLINLLKGKSKWEANFITMTLSLIDGTSVLKLRRLVSKDPRKPKLSEYSWYFFDKNNEWIEYGNVDSTKNEELKVNINSSIIDSHFKQNPKADLIFNNRCFTYKINFITMNQINTQTNVTRPVKRRPTSHLKGKRGQQNSLTDLPDHWDVMQSGERVKRVKILPSSEEYKKVSLLFHQKGGNYNIERIERIQNPYSWRAFQNKIEEIRVLYGNDSSVNIQQLFHGTNPDTVPKICEENFDWRLHGSNVGQAYGRGTYFSPLPKTSYSYTKPDTNGRRYMFIAKVAVGTFTIGNNNMVRPPINSLTNVSFDSTVDNQNSPTIIVKYDKQEYFPEYILTMK